MSERMSDAEFSHLGVSTIVTCDPEMADTEVLVRRLIAEGQRARASEEKFFARVKQLEDAITREADRQAKIAAPVIVLDERVCKWKKGELAGDWACECGQQATFMSAVKWYYCPGCGGKIEVSHE